MDSFWSKLLILGIVAAIGLFFIANVYGPQRSAQEAMAESTQQSVNAVKAGVEDVAATIVKGDAVISSVNQYLNSSDIVDVIVKTSSSTYTFKNSLTSTSGSLVTAITNLTSDYEKVINREGVQIISIVFTEQS